MNLLSFLFSLSLLYLALAGPGHNHPAPVKQPAGPVSVSVNCTKTPNATECQGHDHHDHGEENLVHGLKAMAIGTTLTISLIVNSITIFMVVNVSPLVVSLMTSFSAGVMLVAGVSHVLAEAAETLHNEYPEENVRERYRPPYIVCIGGYLVMVMVQRGLFHVKHHHGATAEVDGEPHNHGEAGNDTNVVEMNQAAAASDPATNSVDNAKTQKTALASAIVLLLAFLIHSVVEGIALGLQQTKEGVILLFIAIIVHQWAEDFTYAMSTGHGSMKLPTRVRFLLSLVEALSCPIGIAIGWGIGVRITKVVTAYLLAFSSGTFVMIACTEVVPETLVSGGRNRLQFLALLFGVGFLYMVQVVMYDEDAHNH